MKRSGDRGERGRAEEAEHRIDVVERQPHQRRGGVAGELERRDDRRPARAVAGHGLDRHHVDARPQQRGAEPDPEPQPSRAPPRSARSRAAATSAAHNATPASATGTRPKRSTASPAARPNSIPATPKPASRTPRATDESPNSSAASDRDEEADAGDARVGRERRGAEQPDPAREHGAQPRHLVARAARRPAATARGRRRPRPARGTRAASRARRARRRTSGESATAAVCTAANVPTARPIWRGGTSSASPASSSGVRNAFASPAARGTRGTRRGSAPARRPPSAPRRRCSRVRTTRRRPSRSPIVPETSCSTANGTR